MQSSKDAGDTVISNTELAGFGNQVRHVREVSGLGDSMPSLKRCALRAAGWGRE